MSVTYKIRTDTVTDEEGVPLTAYGIEAVQSDDESTFTLISVPDIFFSRKKAEDFICMCNEINLSPSHLSDFIEAILDTDKK